MKTIIKSVGLVKDTRQFVMEKGDQIHIDYNVKVSGMYPYIIFQGDWKKAEKVLFKYGCSL